MKKFYKLLILIISFAFLTIDAKAYNAVAPNGSREPNCIDNHTCMLVCNYKQTVWWGQETKSRNISIYYYFDGDWRIAWEHHDNVGGLTRTKKQSFEKLMNSSSITYISSLDKDHFVCPTYGFIDISGLNGDNEVCFSNNQSTCVAASNIGTVFGKDSSNYHFKSTEKDYDVAKDIQLYLDRSGFGDITLEDIKNGTYSSAEQLTTKFERDIKENFLHGNGVPTFVENLSVYKDAPKNISNAFNLRKAELDEEIASQVASGEMTEEEAEVLNETLNTIGDNAESAIQAAQASIKQELPKLPINTNVSLCAPGTGTLKAFQIVGYIIFLMKILVPLLLIILATIDFAKALIATNDKPNTEMLTSLARRCIIAIIIFFIPTVLDFLLSLVDGVSETTSDFTHCTDCLLDPLGKCQE